MIGCFAAWNRSNDVLRKSTSGGMFTALAEKIISLGGVVIGAAYDEMVNVRHEIVDSVEGLARLRGVKYVCGEIGKDVYEGMRKALDSGRQVMFVGLPCQAAAVRKMFGKVPNLLICDLVCFGAPPHLLWRKYVDWMEAKRGNRLVCIDPRDKLNGWGRKTYYRYEWADGSIKRRASLYDPYSFAFYSALAFRRCCFSCQFKGFERISDITLGDFWGAERLGLSKEVVRRGVSGVIVHTVAGRISLEAADVCRMEVGKDVLLAENHMIERSAAMPERWEEFNKDVKVMDFDGLVCKYRLQVTRLRVMKWQLHAWVSRLKSRIIVCVKFARFIDT